MASPYEEAHRRKMLDDRRAQGADAWSPSRAREALRSAAHSFTTPHHLIMRDADLVSATDSIENFDMFCRIVFGRRIDM